MSSLKRSRKVSFALVIMVIALGLSSRKFRSELPVFLGEYSGDALWAAMVYLGLGFLFPRLHPVPAAWSALGISFAVEFSQLYHVEWLDRIRATLVGSLVLGRGFVETDLLCYLVGISIAVAVDAPIYHRLFARGPQSSEKQ